MKRQEARFFIEKNGRLIWLPCEAYQIGPDKTVDLNFGQGLPEELDSIFPRMAYLVFQESEREDEFFDSEKPGLLLELYGFRVEYLPQAKVLMVDKDNNIIIPSSVRFIYEYISRVEGFNARPEEI